MTNYDNQIKQLYEGAWKDSEGRVLVSEHDELDNGSVTDTKQWCQLHRGHCNDVVPMRRHFDNPKRQDEIFLACQKCVRALKKAELIVDSKYARFECYEIVVPRGLSKGSCLEPSTQSFEITLDALQVKYLRALGLKVIPA